MVVLASSAAATAPSDISSVSKNYSADSQSNPSRRPLLPSEEDNAAVPRQPRVKEITSRYLSCHSFSSSSSSRRHPSPLPNHRPSAPPVFRHNAAAKRSPSVDRTRLSTPCTDPRCGGSPAEGSDAGRSLCTVTRSLSVSFQSEPFFFQTTKAKTNFYSPVRQPTPEGRRVSTSPWSSTAGTTDLSENSMPSDSQNRLPVARSRQWSRDCSSEKKDNFLADVHFLCRAMPSDDGSKRASFDVAELSLSCDTDGTSGNAKPGAPASARITPLDFHLPANFYQETCSRLRWIPEHCSPLCPSYSNILTASKMAAARRSVGGIPLPFPCFISSPMVGRSKPSSASSILDTPSRGNTYTSRGRGSSTFKLSNFSPGGHRANAPSIISFAAEMRRSKKGENRIEEAHILRLLDNWYLQCRHVNARINAVLMVQSSVTEKKLYSAWITTLKLRDSVAAKRMELHFLAQHLKLTTILKGQVVCLEEWSILERELSCSLFGAFEALKSNTLRLPVIGGARANLQEVKDAVTSSVDAMQSMGTSICSLLSKVEKSSSLISELIKISVQEQALLDQSKDLLSKVAALNVKQCSLRCHLLQLKRILLKMQP